MPPMRRSMMKLQGCHYGIGQLEKLLLFTRLRACNIAEMELAYIDWEADEIRLPQQKTDQPLTLPLTAVIGNSIYELPHMSCCLFGYSLLVLFRGVASMLQ